jgi:hypothetical protein
MSLGSGLFANQTATLAHLLNAGGWSREIANLRQELAAILASLVGVAIEEYTMPPAAVPAAIMTVTPSSTSAQSYSGSSLNGSVGSGVIFPPRNIEIVTAGATATHAPASVTVYGLDAQGNALSETVTGTNGGANTYPGVKCFARVLGVATPAAAGSDATFSVGTGIVIGLSNTPKLRAGLTTPLIRREIFDGAVVSNGTLTTQATNPPFGAYTPSTAPVTAAAAVVTGNVDITAGALYGVGGTLDGLTLTITASGSTPTSLVLNGATNAASETALLAAIHATWPTLVATQNAGKHLVLTSTWTGYLNTVVVTAGVGSGAAALGLAGATTHGAGYLYCVEYELDGTQIPDAAIQPATVPAVQPPPQP